MKQVTVPLENHSYLIQIGDGALHQFGTEAAGLAQGEAVLVISDENVWQFHGGVFTDSMEQAGVSFTPVIVAAGEHSKRFEVLQTVYEAFAKRGLSRRGLVVAFGGGVVGDLAGFAAATWMRGVRYIQVPTTLLAQVDSSVGGKTAVNLPAGKNLVGTFHQPELVLADTALLETLPAEEFACGMAEIVKYGAIWSEGLFEQLNTPPGPDQLPDIIRTCCAIKSEVVRQDERDTGMRMLLNFGHTFGHAVEALGGYETYHHGQGVAIGMVLAAEIGERLGITKSGCRNRLEAVLKAQSLPVKCPYPAGQLMEHLALDKKSRSGGVDMIFLEDIGKAVVKFQRFSVLESILKEGGLCE